MLSCIALASASTDTDGADLRDIIITSSNSHLLLFCVVENAFTPQMIEGVQNGIPVTFDFRIELERERSGWLDATLSEQSHFHTLIYDSLKQEYRVRLSEKKNHEIVTDSLEEAKKAMIELNGLRVIEIEALEPDSFYNLSLQVKLKKKTLPLNMHNFLPFISLWDFETDLREVRFRY